MSISRTDLMRPAQFSFDEVFAILAKSSFIPVTGDWVIMLTNRSQTLQVEGEDQTMVVCYEATLYKRGDVSKPTWHGPSMDPHLHRYYQIDPKNPAGQTYDAVSDPKVAINPADPKTLCLMTRVSNSWVTTIMRPQTVNGLARLAQLISGRVPLELFLHIVGARTNFSVKETLDTVHQLDVAMREAFGVGPKERAMRMRIADEASTSTEENEGGLYAGGGYA
jgi:hypothetical protein